MPPNSRASFAGPPANDERRNFLHSLTPAYLLCPAWVILIPESEPEIGAIALIGIIYLIAGGLFLSAGASDTGNGQRSRRS